jgi:hypothetical protein
MAQGPWKIVFRDERKLVKDMNRTTILPLLGVVCALYGDSQAGAALIGLSNPTTSPYWADFNVNSLHYQNTYGQVPGYQGNVATFTVTTTANNQAAEKYTTGSLAPGTMGAHKEPGKAFQGGFTLTAHLQSVNNVWTLMDGDFTMMGNLFGTAGETLLKGTLLPGTGGPGGTFGYRASASDPKRFEFLYRVDAGDPTNGKDLILADWRTANGPEVGAVFGGMILNVTTAGWNWAGNWANNFGTIPLTAEGYGDVFVPEPSDYGLLGGGVALAAAILRRRTPPGAPPVSE